MSQAYYRNTLENFLKDDNLSIIGRLNLANSEYIRIWTRTTTSWLASLKLFKETFEELISANDNAKHWIIFLEFEIPRLLSRIDAVIIANDIIIVVEYKDDRKEYRVEDIRQVENYALDLRDFHFKSRGKKIIPLLLAPFAKGVKQDIVDNKNQFVQQVIKSNAKEFASVLERIFSVFHHNENSTIDFIEWEESKYTPTPTIIQAAQALFAGHEVEAIAKSDAENLTTTLDFLAKVIEDARLHSKKIVCFVSGVPGAGKTLVGLSIIHDEQFSEQDNSNAAYFSGNGPLIKVLRAALAKDDYKREMIRHSTTSEYKKPVKRDSEKKVESKIQNLHNFIKDGLRSKQVLSEKIVVFDEAQRCWDEVHFFNQTKRNQNRQDKNDQFEPVLKSEAEVLFEIMDKHQDWAVVVALVGNGQEINTGEGGIQEWGKVLVEKYSHWHIYISNELLIEGTQAIGKKLFNSKINHLKLIPTASLHLAVSLRSFRTEHLNNWVNAILDNNSKEAKRLYELFIVNYPLFITRDLTKAKAWLRGIKEGSKRTGLVASSNALRLRPYGITTKEPINEVHWFLSEEEDIRSSSFLEIAATEYSIQGLEIDWVCLCWDADLRRIGNKWDYKFFSGKKWKNVSDENVKEKEFILNSYRVLLTRAREGMIIWIPEGDLLDETRSPEIYDPIYNYLKTCGVKEI